MTRLLVIHSICAVILLAPSAGRGEVANMTPKIGYLLPAGGQRGSTVEITISGNQIASATQVLLQNPRIEAEVVHSHADRRGFTSGEQKIAIQTAMDLVRRDQPVTDDLGERIPDRPLLWPLKNARATEDDLRRIQYQYFTDRPLNVKQTLNMAVSVRVRLTIPPDVETGRYELRLQSRMGTSNPLYFFVGDCPEVLEAEPCTPDERPVDPPLNLPICINGQTYPGDVDIYRFHAKAGKTLSLHAAARELKPFLADGVPGWFEAVLTLYGPDGQEVAYRDCDHFRPDPTIVYEVPHDGVYEVHLRDSLYRGRWDFIYRLTIREHAPTPTPRFTHTIAEPEAVNTHRFDAKKDSDLCIHTEARVHGSPIDTFLQVTDESGKVLAENDDAPISLNVGLRTAFTDSYLRFTPPADGAYYVRVADTAQLGGPEYGYELSIAPPAPRFDCYVTPAAVDLGAGRGVPVTFHAIRRDGFDGEISIELSDASQGFRLDGATIPAGQNSVNAVLYAPFQLGGAPITLDFVGTSRYAGKSSSEAVIPANEWQQAFVRHHLVPTDSFQVFPKRFRGFSLQFELAQRQPVRLVPGQVAVVQLQMTSRGPARELDFRLLHAPKGVALESSDVRNGELKLTFTSEKTIAQQGNLIVEALISRTGQQAKAGPGQFTAGVLPVIPYGP